MAISAVIGDNGVLTQAQQSAVKTRDAKVQEEVEFAYSTTMSKYYEALGSDSSLTKSEWLDDNGVHLGAELKGSLDSYVYSNDVITMEYKPEDETMFYTVEISSNGTAEVSGGESQAQTPEPSVTTYTVRFYDDSTLGTLIKTVADVEKESTVGSSRMPENEPTKAATAQYTYTFAGWKKASDNSEFTESTIINADTNVYAYWTENAVSTAEWTLPSGDTSISLGDLLTPTITGLINEKFYVIGIDGTGESQTLRLLAQYCIDTTSTVNAQDSTKGIRNSSSGSVTGEVQFASNTKVYANSSIRTLVRQYGTKLANGGLTLEDVEIAQGGDPVENEKARLMWGYSSTSGEVNTVKNTSTALSDIVCKGGGSTNLDYWLGSSVAGNTEGVWYMSGGTVTYNIYYLSTARHAVRPVIKILASKVTTLSE